MLRRAWVHAETTRGYAAAAFIRPSSFRLRKQCVFYNSSMAARGDGEHAIAASLTLDVAPVQQHQPPDEAAAATNSATSTSHAGEALEASTSAHHAATSCPRHGFCQPTQSWGTHDEDSDGLVLAPTAAAPKPKAKVGDMAKRVVFGLLMGVAGGCAVLVKPMFLLAAMFVSYQATFEYYIMVTSKVRCPSVDVRRHSLSPGRTNAW